MITARLVEVRGNSLENLKSKVGKTLNDQLSSIKQHRGEEPDKLPTDRMRDYWAFFKDDDALADGRNRIVKEMQRLYKEFQAIEENSLFEARYVSYGDIRTFSRKPDKGVSFRPDLRLQARKEDYPYSLVMSTPNPSVVVYKTRGPYIGPNELHFHKTQIHYGSKISAMSSEEVVDALKDILEERGLSSSVRRMLGLSLQT